MESLAIIVPCYNEQEALPLFYKEATRVLEKLNYDYKLLLVNDGSKDHTLEIMKSIAQKDEHVRYLSFSRNSILSRLQHVQYYHKKASMF